MKGNRQNIILIVVVLAFLGFLMITGKEEQKWVATWNESDKEPYGGYVLHQMLEERGGVSSAYNTLYELVYQDAAPVQGHNLLLITSGLNLDGPDYAALMQHVEAGNTVLIAADYYGRVLWDSLDIATSGLMLEQGTDLEENAEEIRGEARVNVGFSGLLHFPSDSFAVEAAVADHFFMKSDSIPYTALAMVEAEEMLRHYRFGEGHLILMTNPLLLSNYYILDTLASPLSAGLLSFLPAGEPVIHVEYYRMGRMEGRSPLRYFLSQPQLRSALYLVLAAILLFMMFEAKRRQRIIPVVKPPENSSVVFTRTLGQLYYKSRKDHLNMARKRMNYLLEYIRSHYHIPTENLDEDFEKELIRRSGKDEELIHELVQLLRKIRTGDFSEKEFLKLEKGLEGFYQQS